MQHEEEVRHEGIRLLEVHVRLLREARAALRTHGLGSENKLMDEIDKVEKKLNAWQKKYEELYLRGSSLWDALEKEEELERRRKQDQEKEREDDKMRAKNHSKKLKEKKKQKLAKIICEFVEEEEKARKAEEQRKDEGKELKTITSRAEGNEEKKEGIITVQEDAQLVEKKEEVKEKLKHQESEENSSKRQLEETEEGKEDEENRAKRRRSEAADKPVDTRPKGYRVLVQDVPLSMQYTDFRAYFMQFGIVMRAFLKVGNGSGFVIYEKEEVTDHVCSLQHRVGEQDVKVIKDTPPPYSPSGHEYINLDCAVFVSGVPLGTSTSALRSTLASFGPVTRVSQPRGKNYAFVAFENQSDREAAIRARKMPLNGVTVLIRRARTYSDEGQTSQQSDAPTLSSSASKKHYQVFVLGVTIPMDLLGFQMALAQFGKVVSAYMPEDKNYAFVGFETQEAQQAALKVGSVRLPYGRALIRPVTRREGDGESPATPRSS